MDSDGQASQTFVVDWTTGWTSIDQVSAAQRAFADAGRRMTARGTEVRCLQSVFLSAERRWICLFTAQDSTVAEMTADMAQIPQRLISSAVDLMALPGQSPETL